MQTRDIMTSPVVTVTPDTSVKDAAAALVEHGINAVPVVDDGRRLVGIVSEADLLRLEEPYDVGAGVVTFRGLVGAPARELSKLLARAVPGVVEVRWEPPRD